LRNKQVLICPPCQVADPQWIEAVDRCIRCGSTRLSIVMGSAVCRQCGFDRALEG
jgi:DNA-directed RNA polymerase subunit RPC12/RpoP